MARGSGHHHSCFVRLGTGASLPLRLIGSGPAGPGANLHLLLGDADCRLPLILVRRRPLAREEVDPRLETGELERSLPVHSPSVGPAFVLGSTSCGEFDASGRDVCTGLCSRQPAQGLCRSQVPCFPFCCGPLLFASGNLPVSFRGMGSNLLDIHQPQPVCRLPQPRSPFCSRPLPVLPRLGADQMGVPVRCCAGCWCGHTCASGLSGRTSWCPDCATPVSLLSPSPGAEKAFFNSHLKLSLPSPACSGGHHPGGSSAADTSHPTDPFTTHSGISLVAPQVDSYLPSGRSGRSGNLISRSDGPSGRKTCGWVSVPGITHGHSNRREIW